MEPASELNIHRAVEAATERVYLDEKSRTRCSRSGKIRYTTAVAADNVLREVTLQWLRDRRKMNRRREARVYACRACDGFHLTSQL